MVAQLWRAIIRANHSEEYLRHMRENITPAYRSADGNQSVYLLLDLKGEFAFILLLSFWESRAALEAFSNPQLNPPSSPTEREFVLASEAVMVYEII